MNQLHLFTPRAPVLTIDTESDPGSWAHELTFPCSYRRELLSPLEAFERELEARLALRRSMRPARSASAHKGWAVRRAKAGAK